MKSRILFPILLAAVILTGGYGGHRLRRGAGQQTGSAGTHSISSAEPGPRTQTSATPPPPESPAPMRRWLEAAAELAGNPLADPAVDAPQLLLAMATWSARDFTAAMADAGRLPDGPVRRRIEEWILAQWTERVPVAAMAWTREHRPDKYPAALEALSRRDAAAAWLAVQENPVPGENSGDTVASIFSQWAAQDRMAALEAWLKMDRKANDSFRAGMGFAENALPPKTDDLQAWAAVRDSLTQRVMQEEGANRFTGIDLLKSCLERQVSDAKPAQRREELAAWLRGLQLGETDFAAQLTMVAQHDGCAAGQANEAWPWLWNAIPESQRAPTLKSIIEYWASDQPWSAKDPDACGQWLNTQMPLGPEHSAALKDFAIHATAADPASGLAWAQANPDPATRTAALKEVHARIRKQWPHRMTELGVPPE